MNSCCMFDSFPTAEIEDCFYGTWSTIYRDIHVLRCRTIKICKIGVGAGESVVVDNELTAEFPQNTTANFRCFTRKRAVKAIQLF